MAGWIFRRRRITASPIHGPRSARAGAAPADGPHPASVPGRAVAFGAIHPREIGEIAAKIAAGFLQGIAVVGDGQQVGPGNQRAPDDIPIVGFDNAPFVISFSPVA